MKADIEPVDCEDSGAEGDCMLWRCYDCGQTSEGFYEISYMGGDYDVACAACDSTNTYADGEGFRSEDCPICHGKTVKQVQSDQVCELCGGFASVYPYQLEQAKSEGGDVKHNVTVQRTEGDHRGAARSHRQ